MKTTLILIFFLLVPLVIAVPNLEIEKIDKGSVIVSELDNPAVFDFVIENKGSADQFEIYSLISVSLWPKGKFILEPGKTTIEVKVFPSSELRENIGFFKFEYQLNGRDSGIFKEDLVLNIVNLKDIIELDFQPLNPSDTSAIVNIRNLENTHLESLEIEFDSLFFSGSEEFSIGPREDISISIPLNKEQSGISAGPYIVTAGINTLKGEIEFEGIINYLEKQGTSIEESSKGFIIKEYTITKTNLGNTQVIASVEIKKDVLSRLFTIHSPEPDTIMRKGFFVTYNWDKNLNPNETLVVESMTNYTIPFILLVLIVLVGVIVKVYSMTALSISKKVSFVRTKSGEFALKVSLHVKARKPVKNVQIIDMLPGMTKLYEKFGKKPDRIDPHTKRMFWNIERLTRGEKRVYSYIIYSKVNIVGRFELPHALAIYEYKSNIKETLSNRAYFVAEKMD